MSKEPRLENASLEIWGIVLRNPTITFTDLLLALECWLLFRRLHPKGMPPWIPDRWDTDPGVHSDRPPSWSGFFLFLGIATLLGAANHGIPQYLAGLPLTLTVFASSLAAGLGILHAEAATIRGLVRSDSLRGWLRRGALGKFVVFAVAIGLTQSFLVVILNTALGLVPVTMAECAASRRGNRNSGWVAGGLAFSSVTASVYLLPISSLPRIDHRDLAHILMMVSVLMIYLGVRNPLGSPSASRPALEEA